MAYTTIDDPSAYFQIALYTGNAGFNTITNDGNSDLAPDLIWGKCRSTTKTHYLYDSSRGTEKRLECDNTGVEDSSTNGVLNFYTDGFRLASGNTENDNGETFVAWQWKANAGTVTTVAESGNNPGFTRQTNTAAGFSIIAYTGTGAAGTIAHGLPSTPELIIFKSRSAISDWDTYHVSIGNGNRMELHNEAVASADTTFMNNTLPTSSNITVGTSANTNTNNGTYICYAWSPVQGYSKFGQYDANASTNGPFIYTGFKPAWVLIKCYTGANDSWALLDSARNPTNGQDERLFPDLTNAASTSQVIMDSLSNGFKLRTADSAYNSGRTYLYMAFAENPFVTSTGVPATAR